MIIKNIYEFIDSFAPFNTQLDFDNSGLLVGDMDDYVDKILISLDITQETIYEAKKLGAQVIVSHHPVIFNNIKNVRNNDPLYLLINSKIDALCVHTNLDICNFGINYYFIKKINLKPQEPVKIYNNDLSVGMCSILDREMTSYEFANYLKSKLRCRSFRFTNINSKIKKIAFVSGAGGQFVKNAVNAGIDAFITGEIKHHEILLAHANKMSVFEIGHFISENIMIEFLYNKFKEKFDNVEFKMSLVEDKFFFV